MTPSITGHEQKSAPARAENPGKRLPTISPSELELLRLLAEKPLLSGEQIAAIRTSAAARTWRLLSRLESCGLLICSLAPGQVNIPANRYYHPSEDAVRLLARDEGMAPGRYVKEHWLSASRLTMLFNALDHTKASRQFFVDLAFGARKRHGEGLDVWLDEAAASRRYAWHGEVRLLRPDGCGVYRRNGQGLAFFLEWDSGNSGIERHRRKLRAYHEYRATLGNCAFPAVLAVTVQDRVRQLNRVAVEVSNHRRDLRLPILIAVRTELEARGAFGCRWWDVRSQGSVTLESAREVWATTP